MNTNPHKRWSASNLILLLFIYACVNPVFSSMIVEPQDTPIEVRRVGQTELTASEAATTMATFATKTYRTDAQISPDGAWVAYSVYRVSLATNEEIPVQWYLHRIQSSEIAFQDRLTLPKGASAVRWCPDGRSLSMKIRPVDGKGGSSFARYEVASGELKPISFNDPSPRERPRVTDISDIYEWSPKGNFVAFTAALTSQGGTDRTRGVLNWRVNPRTGLFVVEVATGLVKQLSPDSQNGSIDAWRFSWSPDEAAIVASIIRPQHSFTTDSDLIILERESGKLRPLVTRPGMDYAPIWSPDGKWIAFATHNGDATYYQGWPAIISAQGGDVKVFSKESSPKTRMSEAWWAPDSLSLLYSAQWDMTDQLVRADISTGKTELVSPPHGNLPFDTKRSFTPNRRLMVYTRGSITTPPELFIASLDERGGLTSSPRQITNLNHDFPLTKFVRAERVSWPSKDAKFTIHGLLVTPNNDRNGEGVAARLPLVLCIYGGPMMVYSDFADEGFRGAVLALAARGYAVLIPNTRGRNGYGEAFQRGIRDAKSYGRLPYEDAMAGIDLMIKRGIADEHRLGLIGHSYGAYLAAYTTTQTTRFQAAVIHDGPLDYFSIATVSEPDTAQEFNQRDLYGVGDIFDRNQRENILAQSPVHNADRIKTPTMLQYSTNPGRAMPMLNALRKFNVPSVLFVYDDGHVFSRPLNIIDSLTRMGEWLDFWVRGMPCPNEDRAKEYDSWRTSVAK
jgi:dipeptidyl aminopeptidase/acylaminoacyl peptidase